MIHVMLMLFFVTAVALLLLSGALSVPASAATYNEVESNNSLSAANIITVNNSVSGRLNSKSDEDWFTFTTPSDGYFQIEFQHATISSSSYYWQIRMNEESGNSWASPFYCNVKGNESQTLSSRIGVPAGTYSVKISVYTSSYYSNNSYTMIVRFEASDTWEKEGNDTLAKATPVDVNVKYSGALASKDDDDWYQFTTTSAGYFQVAFDHPSISSSSTYWLIVLYDENGQKWTSDYALYYHVAGNADHFLTAQIGVPAGTYSMKIISYNSSYYSNATYSFTVDFEASDTWEKEGNDTLATATTVDVNVEYGGALANSADVDWYKFTVPSSGYFQVGFDHPGISSSSTYWEILLFDESGKKWASDYTLYYYIAGNAEHFTTAQIGIPAGTYSMKIISYNSSYYSNATYHFTVQFQASNAWEQEENDTLEKATQIQLNKTYKGSLASKSDTDYYQLMVPTKGLLDVTFEHEVITSSSAYWIMYLYGDDGKTWLSKTAPSYNINGNESLTDTGHFSVSAGIYNVKIVAYSSSYHLSSTYSLSASFSTLPTNWESEPNDAFDSATPIKVGSDYQGSISSSGDRDHYSFTVNDSMNVFISFSHKMLAYSGVYWDIYIYNSKNSKVYTWGSYANVESDRSKAIYLSAGKYYICVAGRSYYSTADYTFKIYTEHDHTGTWKDIGPVTCLETRQQERVCEICGLIETQEAEPLGHQWDEGVYLEDATLFHIGVVDHKCLRCGERTIMKDKSVVWLWWPIIVGAVMLIFGIACYVHLQRHS